MLTTTYSFIASIHRKWTSAIGNKIHRLGLKTCLDNSLVVCTLYKVNSVPINLNNAHRQVALIYMWLHSIVMVKLTLVVFT